ncbi:transposase mutator type [Alicyclobacillus hesperidum URH17-3-68]|nr:transposase mutator type [Alicyclobacillus hesperidum URH17-3-68]
MQKSKFGASKLGDSDAIASTLLDYVPSYMGEVWEWLEGVSKVRLRLTSEKSYIQQFIKENDLKSTEDVQAALRDMFASTM